MSDKQFETYLTRLSYSRKQVKHMISRRKQQREFWAKINTASSITPGLIIPQYETQQAAWPGSLIAG